MKKLFATKPKSIDIIKFTTKSELSNVMFGLDNSPPLLQISKNHCGDITE